METALFSCDHGRPTTGLGADRSDAKPTTAHHRPRNARKSLDTGRRTQLRQGQRSLASRRQPSQIANAMEERFCAGVADGFNKRSIRIRRTHIPQTSSPRVISVRLERRDVKRKPQRYAMGTNLQKGEKVAWETRQGSATGKVVQKQTSHTHSVARSRRPGLIVRSSWRVKSPEGGRFTRPARSTKYRLDIIGLSAGPLTLSSG